MHNAQSAPILSALHDDMLQRIAGLLRDEDGGDLACFRLACRSFRAHSAPPAHKRRKAFLRSRARVAHAWSHPGFQLERRAMWQLAVGVGSVDVLDWLRSQLTGALDASICAAAARAGQLSALQWLRGQDCPWDSYTYSDAAGGGHLEVLKWAREHGCDWNSFTCSWAATGGHLEVLRWAIQAGCSCDKPVCLMCAARGGHRDVVAWINAAPA